MYYYGYNGGYAGGKGAYVKGKIYLIKGQSLYVNVGQKPSGGAGGWNGGGSNLTSVYGGGGATDISLYGTNGTTSWNTTNDPSRFFCRLTCCSFNCSWVYTS